jgi:hypothetical protein
MRVVLQGLALGVENHGHAELSAEMPGISRDGGSVSAAVRNRIEAEF